MTTFSSSLKLTLIGDGEQTGVWGNTTNTNLGTLIEQALCYQTTVTMTSGNDYTLTSLNGAPDEARSATLIIQGTQAGTNAVICPAKQKVYVITNKLSSGTAYVKPAGGTVSVAIPNGKTIVAYCTGTEMQAVDYTTTSGTATTATTATNLASGVQGSVPFQSAAGVTSFVDPIASPSSAGKVLTSNGINNNPTWTAIPTPAIANNLANGTAGQVPYQTGANTTTFTTGGSNGQVLALNSSGVPVWTPLAVSGGTVTSVTASSPLASSGSSVSPNISLSGIVPVINGGTGSSTLTGAGIAQLSGGSGAAFTGDVSSTGYITSTGGGGGSSFLTATSVQIGTSGVGAVYAIGGAFDGGNGIGFINGGGKSIQISSSGNFFTSAGTCYKTGSTTAWDIFSDSRIKKNVTPYTKGLAELNQVQIKNFEFNGLGNSKEGDKGLGVIADEIELVLPDTVKTVSTKLHPEDEEKINLKTFNSTELVYLLVNAVKELNAKVDAQAAQIAALQG